MHAHNPSPASRDRGRGVSLPWPWDPDSCLDPGKAADTDVLWVEGRNEVLV